MQKFIVKIPVLSLIIALLLLLPLFTFRLRLNSEIFPALEIIIVYYLYTNFQIKYWQVFASGIVLDQLYSMPLATNALSFIAANLILSTRNLSKTSSNYLLDFLNFSGYCLIVMSLRYLIIMSIYEYLPNIYVPAFQYLSTVFSYPLLKTLLNKFKTLNAKC